MATLSKADILQARKPKIETVFVEEWGGDVCVRVPSSADLNMFEAETAKRRERGKAAVNFDARVAIMVCCDESGNALFVAPDEQALSLQSSLAVRKIQEHVAPWFGWAERDVEHEAKNSQTTQGEGSTTG